MGRTHTSILEMQAAGFIMQRHKPEVMPDLHSHGHVEILLPVDCQLSYQTQLGLNIAPANHLCVLWGQIPHRVTKVVGDGEINEGSFWETAMMASKHKLRNYYVTYLSFICLSWKHLSIADGPCCVSINGR